MDWRKRVMSRIKTLKELQTLTVYSTVKAWQEYKKTGSDEAKDHFESCMEDLDKYHSQMLALCWDYGRGVAEDVQWTRTEKPVEPRKTKKAN